MSLIDWVRRRRRRSDSNVDPLNPAHGESGASEVAEVGALDRAIQCHTGGDLDGAERSYKNILTEDPDFVPALHLLGRLHAQRGEPAAAAACLERAAVLAPTDPSILADLARVRLIESKPADAESLLRKVIDLDSNDPDARFALAQILVTRGMVEDAVSSYKKAILLRPEFAEAYNDLGALYLEAGELESAKVHLQRALQLNAGLVSARRNLAHLYVLTNDFANAESQYLGILDGDPTNGQALEQLGRIYELLGDNEKALRNYEALAAGKPDQADPWRRLGELAQKLGLIPEAIAYYENSIKLDPEQPETLNNLGSVYGVSGQFEQAAACLEAAVALCDTLDSVFHNLGSTYHLQGRRDEAIEAYEKALKLTPNSHSTLSNLISINHFTTDQDTEYMSNLLERFLESVAPERIKANIPKSWDRTHNRRLKIGYVSPDFRQHSVCYFISPAITGHDRSQFEVFCYSDVAREDYKTELLKSAADQWRNICGLDNEAVTDLIRQDRIDILVDLDGHYADNRLPVFAERPAPVQISYLGYPSTTGLPEMDYRLTDSTADPEGGAESEYTETLIRFPQVFLCYEPPLEAPPVAVAQHARCAPCFGSFNELQKITFDVVHAWSAILEQVPDSTLLLKARAFSDTGTKERVCGWFADAGVEPSRLELLARTPTLEEHLALYARVDVALDTFPYNGTTTTCEALFMGVPVITVRGNSHVSRVGESLLTVIGLETLIAESEDAYIQKAVTLASDKLARSRLRESIREQMLASPLTDKHGFVRSLEAIFRQLWNDWCDETSSLNERRRRLGNDHKSSISGAVGVTITDSNVIWLPDDLNRLTTYVLCEQETWFEDEFEFVRCYLSEGMRMLDVGANYGMYTLAAAKKAGSSGRVWSFEPASTTCRWLGANVRYNGYDNVQVLNRALSDFNGTAKLRVYSDTEYNHLVSESAQQAPGELVDVKRLDGCVIEQGISKVDFVKLDAEGAEKQILDGGQRFFAEEMPLVMFEIKSGGEPDWSLIEKFYAIGYSVYRLVSGLGVLVPAGEPDRLDAYALNLFACGHERAEELSRCGLLLSSVPASPSCPVADEATVWRYFESQRYSKELVDVWRAEFKTTAPAHRQQLFRVLGCYVAAHDPSVLPGDAAALLSEAYAGYPFSETGDVNPGDILSKARIAGELGYRSEAVGFLSALMESNAMNESGWARRPFIPASRHFEAISPDGKFSEWGTACLLDAHLQKLAFSSHFMGEEQLDQMERLRKTGFERPEMERRRLLLSARHGRDTAAPSAGVLTASASNLNPDFWCKRFQDAPHNKESA